MLVVNAKTLLLYAVQCLMLSLYFSLYFSLCLLQQADADMSPQQAEKESELERNLMHSRMTSTAGHYTIRMAMCRRSEPQRLLTDFPEADKEAIELMQTLDERVVELLADTPLLTE